MKLRYSQERRAQPFPGSYISSVSYLSNLLLKLQMSMGQESNTPMDRREFLATKKMQTPKRRGQNRERQRKEGEGQRKGGKKREGGEGKRKKRRKLTWLSLRK